MGAASEATQSSATQLAGKITFGGFLAMVVIIFMIFYSLGYVTDRTEVQQILMTVGAVLVAYGGGLFSSCRITTVIVGAVITLVGITLLVLGIGKIV